MGQVVGRDASQIDFMAPPRRVSGFLILGLEKGKYVSLVFTGLGGYNLTREGATPYLSRGRRALGAPRVFKGRQRPLICKKDTCELANSHQRGIRRTYEGWVLPLEGDVASAHCQSCGGCQGLETKTWNLERCTHQMA